MKLGEILMSEGLITPWQLELALAIQQRTKRFLGEILIENDWIRDDQLIHVLSEQFEIPCELNLSEKVDWSLAEHYSELVDENGTCFPIKQDATALWVAISNPLDAWTISMVERQARGRDVKLVLATQAQIRSMVKTFRRINLGNGHGL